MPGPVYTVAAWNGLGVRQWNRKAQTECSENHPASAVRLSQLVSSKRRKYLIRFYANRLLERPAKINRHKIAWAWYYYLHVAIPFNASAIRSIPKALQSASDAAYECIDGFLAFMLAVLGVLIILPLRTIFSPLWALVAIWWYWPAFKDTPRKDLTDDPITNNSQERR